ncbi:AAA family ATPase [Sutcliffiella sp. NPDC057660]|uniref:AAA family ATPase n=1 Tax=Sutcliffiella sp. NPDC057660 TaxID=3346199 RepID=UPI00367D14DC
MKIQSITVKGYRSIGIYPPLKLDLGELTVLTGANNSGKTSALIACFLSTQIITNSRIGESIQFRRLAALEGSRFFDEVEGQLTDHPTVKYEVQLNQIQINKIFDVKKRVLEKYLSQLNAIEIYVTIEAVNEFLRDLKITLNVLFDPSSYLFLQINDFVDKELFNSFCFNYFNYSEDSKIGEFLEFTEHLYELVIEYGVRDFFQNLDSLLIPSSTRDKLFNQKLEEIDVNKEVTSELVEFFKEISKEESRRNGEFRRFFDYCKVLFPDLERIEIDNPVSEFIKEDLFLSWTKNKILQRHPLSRSGAGITNVLYMISKLLRKHTNTSIVFVDEPENGLHPKLQVRFLKLLKMLSREFELRVILSTHSPFLMQKLKVKDKLYLIEHDGNKTTSRLVDLEKKEEAFHALGSYLPLSLTANGLIFVEGQTEVKVLTTLLDKADLDIENEGLLIVPLGGENLFAIPPRDLKKIHDKCIVIIDSDLRKSIEEGGNIKSSKLNYEQECNAADVSCVLLKEYRTIENMYPKEILASVLNTVIENLNHSNFDEIPELPNSRKALIGEKVAEEMSKEQALVFPLIKKIIEWWKD